MVRVSNQDAILQETTSFAVCDGMGGHAGGEVASAAAVSALRSSLMTTTTAEGLREAIVAANDAVLAAGEGKPELVGMGTTCVAAVLVGTNDGDRLLLANVGDSRGYLFRRGELSQVTEDHSMVAQLIRDGLLDQAEAASHPQRHVITRVLGLEGSVEVDLLNCDFLKVIGYFCAPTALSMNLMLKRSHGCSPLSLILKQPQRTLFAEPTLTVVQTIFQSWSLTP